MCHTIIVALTHHANGMGKFTFSQLTIQCLEVKTKQTKKEKTKKKDLALSVPNPAKLFCLKFKVKAGLKNRLHFGLMLSAVGAAVGLGLCGSASLRGALCGWQANCPLSFQMKKDGG